MAEQALAAVYEVRHYATSSCRTACGAGGLMTTSRHHVNCVDCLRLRGLWHADRRPPVVSDPDAHPPQRPTLGESAVRELAELRGRILKLASLYEQQENETVADDLESLLHPNDNT